MNVKKRKTLQRILAVVGLILVVAMIVITVISALSGSPEGRKFSVIALGGTIILSVIIYIILMLIGKYDK